MQTFGWALKQMQNGARVARSGWNGKGMWIAMTPSSVIEKRDARAGAARLLAQEPPTGLPGSGEIRIGAHIDMKAADGSLVIGWLASQTDMQATDWDVVL